MAIRLNKIKKDLNLDISKISRYCNQIGIFCDFNPNRKITDDQYSRLLKHINIIEQNKLKSNFTTILDSIESIFDIDNKKINSDNDTEIYISKSDIRFKVMKFYSAEKQEKEETEFRNRILKKIQPDLMSYFEECCIEAKQQINFINLSSINRFDSSETNQNVNKFNTYAKTNNKNHIRSPKKDEDLIARLADLKNRKRKFKEELARNKRKKILAQKKKGKLHETNSRGPHYFGNSMSGNSVYDKIQTFGLGKVIYIAKK